MASPIRTWSPKKSVAHLRLPLEQLDRETVVETISTPLENRRFLSDFEFAESSRWSPSTAATTPDFPPELKTTSLERNDWDSKFNRSISQFRYPKLPPGTTERQHNFLRKRPLREGAQSRLGFGASPFASRSADGRFETFASSEIQRLPDTADDFQGDMKVSTEKSTAEEALEGEKHTIILSARQSSGLRFGVTRTIGKLFFSCFSGIEKYSPHNENAYRSSKPDWRQQPVADQLRQPYKTWDYLEFSPPVSLPGRKPRISTLGSQRPSFHHGRPRLAAGIEKRLTRRSLTMVIRRGIDKPFPSPVRRTYSISGRWSGRRGVDDPFPTPKLVPRPRRPSRPRFGGGNEA